MSNPHSNLMVRKHCGDFLRQYHLRDAETLVAHKREWSQLGKIKRDAKREMDERNEAGNRSPRPNPHLAKIPICEGRTAPAFDDGQANMPAPEAFALRSDQSVRTWA